MQLKNDYLSRLESLPGNYCTAPVDFSTNNVVHWDLPNPSSIRVRCRASGALKSVEGPRIWVCQSRFFKLYNLIGRLDAHTVEWYPGLCFGYNS